MDVTDSVEGVVYKEMAQKDSLTGALSRQYMMSIFEQDIIIAMQQKHDLSIAMMDINHFKQINDQYGHLVGDMALKHFTAVVQSQIRNTDILSRFGGDEFVILFRQTTKEAVLKTIGRINAALQTTSMSIGTDAIILSMSYGISDLDDGNTCEALLHAADQRMYGEKHKINCGVNPQP
jgi:diguanylate cyclase (GGDEF)-like protein